MTLAKFTLDYNALDTKQLQDMVRQRTELPKSKEDCINTLRGLDRNAVFRFLDLPPEMRNSIYELVLHHNRDQGAKAYPNLLRTCKQVYQEARSILYDQSTLNVCASFFILDDVFGTAANSQHELLNEGDWKWIKYHYIMSEQDRLDFDESGGKIDDLTTDGTYHDRYEPDAGHDSTKALCHTIVKGDLRYTPESISLKNAMDCWPTSLTDIPRIELTIRLDFDEVFGEYTDHVFNRVNVLLYALVSTLNGGTKPQTVTITLQNEINCDELGLLDWFNPLTKLRDGIWLHLNDFPEHVFDCICKERAGENPPPAGLDFDILREGKEVLEGLHDYIVGPSRVHGDDFVDDFRKYVRRVLEDDRVEWWVSGEDEWSFLKATLLAKEICENQPCEDDAIGRRDWVARIQMMWDGLGEIN